MLNDKPDRIPRIYSIAEKGTFMSRSARFSALAIAVLAALAAPAHAVKPTTSTATAMPACSFSDLTGLSVLACTG